MPSGGSRRRISPPFWPCKAQIRSSTAIIRPCRPKPPSARICPRFPPEKTAADKYYAGFFSGEQLIAVLDLILGYPDAQTAFLGFFMTAAAVQKKGVGSTIVANIRTCCKRLGFTRLRLAIDEGNPQSEAFWTKNGFRKTSERRISGAHTYLPMELPL